MTNLKKLTWCFCFFAVFLFFGLLNAVTWVVGAPDKCEDRFSISSEDFSACNLIKEGWSTGVVHGLSP